MSEETTAGPVHVRRLRKLIGRRTSLLVFDLETTDLSDSLHVPDRATGTGHPTRFAPGAAPAWVAQRFGGREPASGYPHPTCRVVQLAAIRYEWDPRTRTGTRTDELNCLIDDPDVLDCCMSPDAIRTHGISIAELRAPAGNPYLAGVERLSPRAAWSRFLALADGAVLMGQNILGFDVPVAQYELVRHGFSPSLDPERSLDVLQLAREVWGLRSNTLRSLATFFAVATDPTRDHDAMADNETCWGVWTQMQPGLLDWDRRFGEGVVPDQYRGRLGSLGAAWPIIEPGTETWGHPAPVDESPNHT